MTTVFSPNIVIAKSYNAIRKFMDSPNGKVSNFDIKDSQDIILFSKSQNKYVYGLEHNHGYSSGDIFIKLKILDSDGSFEQDFFNEDTLLSTAVAGIKKRIQQTKSLRDFAGSLYKSSRSRINIYLAYGIGDDLVNWTNPITAQLRGIDIDVSNNGLRSYTYTFTPLLNNFLLPQVKKDPDNPSEDYLLDLLAGNVATEASIKAEYEKLYENPNDKLKQLLTDYVAKSVVVDKGNVICLLPDIENQVKEKISQDFSYPSYFKSILVEQEPDREVFRVLKKQRNKDDVDQIEKSSQSTTTDTTSNTTEKRLQNKQNKVDSLNKEKTKVEQNLRSLQANLSDLLAGDTTETGSSVSINTGAGSLINDPVEEKRQKRIEVTRQSIITSKKRLKEINNNLKKLNEIGPIPPLNLEELQIDAEDEKQFVPGDYKLTIRTQTDLFDNNNDKAQLPNSREAVTKIFNGFGTLLEGTYPVECIAFESDTRWLKLFKEVGLIADETQPCLIVGERQMVLDYIYCNQVPSSDINNIKCIFNINQNDSYYKILTSQEYKQKVIDIINRKKISSSFSEKIVLDELVYATDKDKQGDTKAAIDAALNYATTNDIPFFINNFRNSNVISFSLKNTETYFGSVQQAVYDDRLKNMFGQITEEDIRGLLEPFGLEANEGIEGFVKKYIDLAESDLRSAGFYDKKNDKVDELVLAREKLEKDFTAEISEIDKIDKIPTARREITNRRAFDNLESDLYVKFKRLTPSITTNSILLTNSVENVTYLNVALQLIFSQNKKIPKEEVFFLSDFIIALNAVMQVNGNAGLKIIPGLTLPGKEFILSRINEYNIRNSRLLNIKTLPFFTLSNQRTINKPSVFYSKRITPIGKQSNFILDYFSGEYRITGFRHVIGINECYSEFSLTKYNTTS